MIITKSGVSVVIPTYNRSKDLLRALKSLQGQSYKNWEAIIVDNYSDDDTDNVVTNLNDSRISILKIHNNGVIAASRNKGIENARKDFIAFLDSDDWWTPDKLQKSVDLLQQGFDLVYHDLWIVNGNKRRIFSKKVGVRKLTKPAFDDLIKNGNAIPNSSVVVRTKLLREINGLSEDVKLIAAEDYDCWLRLSRITEGFACLPDVLGYYSQGANNNSTAERRSECFERLQVLYFDPFIARQGIEMPTWIVYNSARIAYLLGNLNNAYDLFKALSKRALSGALRIKVVAMLITIRKQIIQ